MSSLELIEKFLGPVGRLAEVKPLRAMRDGIVSILPLIIVGSFFLLLGSLPVSAVPEAFLDRHGILKSLVGWYEGHTALFLQPYRLTMNLMSLFASFSVAYFMAKAYSLEALPPALLSAAAFLVMQTPRHLPAEGGGKGGEWILGLTNFGGRGLFAAILAAFFTVEIVRFFAARKWGFRMPEGVPPAVCQAFSALLPALVVISAVWGISGILGVDLPSAVLGIFSPLVAVGDSFFAVILLNLIMHLIWLGGLHGASIIVALMMPVWMGYLDANSAAVAAHQALPYVTTLPFYQWFVWIGGSGCTLSLAFLMLFSRSKTIRDLGRVALLPGICNINEPIIFGLPIMMNPILALPFVLSPILAGTLSYWAIRLGLVNSPSILVPWTLPGPLGAFLSTGFDWRAVALVGVIMLLTGLLYWPFLRAYEKQELEVRS